MEEQKNKAFKGIEELQVKFGSQYGKEEENAVLTVIREGAPTSSEWCLTFEENFAEYCGSKYAKTVSNGTAALFLSLVALGVGPGDIVVTTPLTWIASASVGVTLGAKVVFADIDPNTYNMDMGKLEQVIRTCGGVKAVIPVHLYGQCCDMDQLMFLSRKYNFAVVEDACHAPGAEYRGKKAGTFGSFGCFSFHEQKNISTLGEGGMVVTDDPELFEKLRLYRSHCTRVYGKSTKYCSFNEERQPENKQFWFQDFDDCGYNFRMADVQAAVGIEQLKKLDSHNQKRIDIARVFDIGLQNIPGVRLPYDSKMGKHIYHLYPILIDEDAFGVSRDDLVYDLYYNYGIKVGTHYRAIHLSKAFRKRGFTSGMFPAAEYVSDHIATLPIHPRLTPELIDYLIKAIREIGGWG
ncbi:MAG: DegT/DnrJ/EryC1/StrS family aminotransferase [Spirochaetia bacterium]|nr:DegT/DnrJ/EryC1/StrS family aminotransferase [Spirochaetia bacterium]